MPFFDRLATDNQYVPLDNAGHMPIDEPGLTQVATAVRAFIPGLTPSSAPNSSDGPGTVDAVTTPSA